MPYHTYHCLCTELIIAVPSLLGDLPHRQNDAAIICSSDNIQPFELHSVTVAPHATIYKLEDGFEKRYALGCARCRLTVGYQLDWSQYAETTRTEAGAGRRREDVVYLLPGGLMSTSEMEAGRDMSREVGVVGASAVGG